MESKDALKRRIDAAAKYAPMEQLALSPAMRLFKHGARQQHRGGRPAQQAAPGGGNGAGDVGGVIFSG
jgi:hypothetical protein